MINLNKTISVAKKVKEDFSKIEKVVAESCTKARRNPGEVRILAATKSQPIEKIQAAIEAGIKICGENYVAEAEEKINKIGKAVEWHFIGHLQSNKTKKAVGLFDCIQSVDSLKLAKKIDNTASKPFPIFIAVNIGKEKSKFGVLPENLCSLYSEITKFPNLDVRGLFCIAPFLPSEQTRIYFQKMKQLAEQLSLKELSMGMSRDYTVAIEGGSTMIRLGTTLFGKRKEN